jgi:multisubunit Na+/H+ antiporter MnhB subunit
MVAVIAISAVLIVIMTLHAPQRGADGETQTVAIALGVCCMMVAYFYFIGPSD